MLEHLSIRCPRCEQELRVRTEYLGRKVLCKFCGHKFVASQAPAGPPSGSEKAANGKGTSGAGSIVTEASGVARDPASEVLRAKAKLQAARTRVKQLEQERQQERDDLARLPSLLVEVERLRSEALTLGERAAQAARLEEERDRSKGAFETLRVQHDEADARNSATVTSITADRDRLAAELERLRSSPPTMTDDEALRCRSERDLAVAERERIQQEYESLREELTAARAEIERMSRDLEATQAEGRRIDEEREALLVQRKVIQETLRECERSLLEKDADLSRERQGLELARVEDSRRIGAERKATAAEQDDLRIQVASAQREGAEHRVRLEATTAELQSVVARGEDERAAHQQVVLELRATIDRLSAERDSAVHERELEVRARAEAAEALAEAARLIDLKEGQITESSRQVKALKSDLSCMSQSSRLEAGLPPRPGASAEQDPHESRIAIQEWLDQAQEALAVSSREVETLAAEVQAASNELELLNRDLALGDWDEQEIAFPFEES